MLLEQAQNFESMILNFTHLGYVSSAGLRMLKTLRMTMRKKSGKLIIKGANKSVMEIFEMTGVAALFQFI